jgi:peptide/nickel transport system ATP-binding protein
MIFQDPIGSLSPRRTVGSLIAEPLRLRGIPKRAMRSEIERFLSLVGLRTEFAARYPYQLSGGQARRVGVARALAVSPKLIIADEPTAGLDVSVQGEMLNLLARLQRELDLAYIIITHNLAVVRLVSDEMAVMYMGRFVEKGPTRLVYAQPLHPYTHGLLAAQPRMDPRERRESIELQGEVPSLQQRPSGCEFHPRCPRAAERCSREAPQFRSAGAGRYFSCHYPL